MASRPTKAKMLKHYPNRGLFSNTPVGVVNTNIGSTVAADPAPDDQPIIGVGNAAGEPQPATEEEPAPAKKRTKLNLKDVSYVCFAILSSYPPRMNWTICDAHRRIKSGLLLTKHGLDTHLASENHVKAVRMAEAAVMADKIPRTCLTANCN